MKVRVNDSIRTVVDVDSDFSDRVIPAGTSGRVIEYYDDPPGYVVDLAIPDDGFVGGYSYENVVLRLEQFIVEPGPSSSEYEEDSR